MFYQAPTEIQKIYFNIWREAGRTNKALLPLIKKRTKNHYFDHYLGLSYIYKNLHPYQFISKEDTILVCGCHNEKINLGVSQPLIFSALAKHVIILEPDPINTKTLNEYIKDYQIKNITVIEKAIWEEELDEIEFISHKNATATNRIGNYKNKQGERIKVATTTIDNLKEAYENIKFVHLTINGVEKEVIKAAKKTLKTDTIISVAMINKNHHMFSDRIKALDILKKNGYYIGWGNGQPAAWLKNKFYFAVGTKDKEKLISLGFKKESKDFDIWSTK